MNAPHELVVTIAALDVGVVGTPKVVHGIQTRIFHIPKKFHESLLAAKKKSDKMFNADLKCHPYFLVNFFDN